MFETLYSKVTFDGSGSMPSSFSPSINNSLGSSTESIRSSKGLKPICSEYGFSPKFIVGGTQPVQSVFTPE